MNTRNILLGIVAIAAFAGALWWQTQPAPAEKPASAATAAKPVAAVPASTPSVPTSPLKSGVVAPTAPPVMPSAEPKPAEPAKSAGKNPELDAAVNDLLAILDSRDVNALVQNYFAPSMMDMAREAASTRLSGNATPEMRAQIEQALQQQLPQMIQQITQQMAQDPRAAESFQKLGVALRRAQANPPQMNDAGDQATYTLEVTDDKDVPPAVIWVRRDGRWTLDFMSMARGGRGGF